MKTAISIPNSVFQSTEIMAQHLAIPDSELFTKAISEYLEAHFRAHSDNGSFFSVINP